MESWANLKVAVDRLGSELKQILLVKSDVTMLQKDLTTQEDLWRKAEDDLQAEIAALESQATALRGEVRSGAHIHDDVEELKRSLQAERGMAAEVQAAYEHEEAQAKLEKQRLETRIMQLQLRKAEDNRTGTEDIQEARDREMAAREQLAELSRKRSEGADELADRQQQYSVQQHEAEARQGALFSQLESLNATEAHLRSRLIPKAVIDGQLASMKVTLEKETQAIIMVQTAVTELAAKCTKQTDEVQEVLLEEEAKAEKAHAEMEPLCNRVRSARQLLQQMVAETCGTGGNQSASVAPPTAMFAPSPAAASEAV